MDGALQTLTLLLLSVFFSFLCFPCELLNVVVIFKAYV